MFYIVHFGSSKTPYIRQCIEGCGEAAEIFEWEQEHKKPSGIKGIIFSGSPVFLTEVDHEPFFEHISPLLHWRVPILGICFGHQVLGILHGARIYRGKEVRTKETIRVINEHPLFEGLGAEFEMREDHTEGIDLPPGFYPLAFSSSYPNEGMVHAEKPFFGIQFHPEVSDESGIILFLNFIEICNSHKA